MDNLGSAVFVVMGAVMAFAAVRIVTTRNVVHSALYLLVVLAGAAGVFLLMAAEFVGWVQVLIYVGAVVVLILFGLMLTKAPIGKSTMDSPRRGLAALIAGSIFAGTATILWRTFDGQSLALGTEAVYRSTAETLGASLFTDFVLPFEVASVLLLAALVGAVVLAKKDN